MAKRDYQVVSEITWADEFCVGGNRDKRSTLKSSYGTLCRAMDEIRDQHSNPAIEHETVKIIYKPTGEIIKEVVTK